MRLNFRVFAIIFVCAVLILAFMTLVANANANDTRSIKIQVTADGQWSGFYINQDVRENWNGTGNTTLVLNRPNHATVWNIIVRVTDEYPSSSNLIVRIVSASGAVLDEDYTSTEGTSALATYTVTPPFCFGEYYKCLSES
jgi:hypothetical protein